MSDAKLKLGAIVKTDDRIAVFIDGHATQGASKSIDLKIDWLKFQILFMELGRVRRLGFYLTVPEEIDANDNVDQSSGKPWWKSVVDWMSYNNYKVVLRKGSEFNFVDTKKIGIKSSVDLALAVDAMAVAEAVDHIILFTGNSDFIHLVQGLQAKNIVVTIVSNSFNKMKELNKVDSNSEAYPFIASKALIKCANNFIDLADFQKLITVTTP